VKRLELPEQRPRPFPQFHLGEQDADGPVPVDEEVGALSAGPAVPPPQWSLRPHSDAEPPAHAVPEAWEEAVGGFIRRRHLVTGHLLQMLGREQSRAIRPAAVDEHAGEAVEVGDGGDQLAMAYVEGRRPGVEATAGRFDLDQSVLAVPVRRG
jgi:hypothetical protein